jgi:hypothetical protein
MRVRVVVQSLRGEEADESVYRKSQKDLKDNLDNIPLIPQEVRDLFQVYAGFCSTSCHYTRSYSSRLLHLKITLCGILKCAIDIAFSHPLFSPPSDI